MANEWNTSYPLDHTKIGNLPLEIRTLKGSAKDRVPAGATIMWPTATAPTGWLLCTGTAVSRTTYSDLFTEISTTFGVGDGSTTFNLPDLVGRVVVGKDAVGTRVSANNDIGEADGHETHTLTEAEMPAHTHGLDYDGDSFTAGGVSGIDDTGDGTWDTGSAGSGTAHNNMQPYLVLNYIIKT